MTYPTDSSYTYQSFDFPDKSRSYSYCASMGFMSSEIPRELAHMSLMYLLSGLGQEIT